MLTIDKVKFYRQKLEDAKIEILIQLYHEAFQEGVERGKFEKLCEINEKINITSNTVTNNN